MLGKEHTIEVIGTIILCHDLLKGILLLARNDLVSKITDFILSLMNNLRFNNLRLKKIFLFFGWARPEFPSSQARVGPPRIFKRYPQATSYKRLTIYMGYCRTYENERII
jgi:hypothetical protein